MECVDTHSKQIPSKFIKPTRKKIKNLKKLREKGDPRGGGIIYPRIVFAFAVRHGGYEGGSYGVSEETIF